MFENICSPHACTLRCSYPTPRVSQLNVVVVLLATSGDRLVNAIPRGGSGVSGSTSEALSVQNSEPETRAKCKPEPEPSEYSQWVQGGINTRRPDVYFPFFLLFVLIGFSWKVVEWSGDRFTSRHDFLIGQNNCR